MRKQNASILLLTILLTSCTTDTELLSNSKADIITTFIQANGELSSNNSISISPPSVNQMWQYKVTYIAPEGSIVKKGTPLISFDSSSIKQKLDIKTSELKTSKKSLENIQLTSIAEFERKKLDLAEAKMKQDKANRKWIQSKGLESKLELKKLKIQDEIEKNEVARLTELLEKTVESNNTKLLIEKSKVERLHAEVKTIQDGIKKLTVTSPKDGMVIYKTDYRGDKATIGDTVWMGRQLLEIPTLENMIVRAEIAETDAGKLKVGQEVEITLDAIPESTYTGKVQTLGMIFRKKSAQQTNVVFDADILLDKTDSDLMRPGMAARLKIITGEG